MNATRETETNQQMQKNINDGKSSKMQLTVVINKL